MSWNYHMYGGWNGWNPTFDAVEPSNNNTDGGKVTDRLQMLLAGWKRNASNAIAFAAPRLDGGQLLFNAIGLTVGKTYLMQVSTNLTSWTPISTNVAVDISLGFTNAMTLREQYFRFFQLP